MVYFLNVALQMLVPKMPEVLGLAITHQSWIIITLRSFSVIYRHTTAHMPAALPPLQSIQSSQIHHERGSKLKVVGGLGQHIVGLVAS